MITSAVLARLALGTVLSHVALLLTDLAFDEWACITSVLAGVTLLASTDLGLEMLC
jgi:hypothetical protein